MIESQPIPPEIQARINEHLTRHGFIKDGKWDEEAVNKWKRKVIASMKCGPGDHRPESTAFP
jgi:hypothetical protein